LGRVRSERRAMVAAARARRTRGCGGTRSSRKAVAGRAARWRRVARPPPAATPAATVADVHPPGRGQRPAELVHGERGGHPAEQQTVPQRPPGDGAQHEARAEHVAGAGRSERVHGSAGTWALSPSSRRWRSRHRTTGGRPRAGRARRARAGPAGGCRSGELIGLHRLGMNASQPDSAPSTAGSQAPVGSSRRRRRPARHHGGPGPPTRAATGPGAPSPPTLVITARAGGGFPTTRRADRQLCPPPVGDMPAVALAPPSTPSPASATGRTAASGTDHPFLPAQGLPARSRHRHRRRSRPQGR